MNNTFNLPPDPVPITPGEIFIDVWNMRAAVARFYALPDGSIGREYASNTEELEQEAAGAVYDQGGYLNLSGLYTCPRELAERAQWNSTARAEE